MISVCWGCSHEDAGTLRHTHRGTKSLFFALNGWRYRSKLWTSVDWVDVEHVPVGRHGWPVGTWAYYLSPASHRDLEYVLLSDVPFALAAHLPKGDTAGCRTSGGAAGWRSSRRSVATGKHGTAGGKRRPMWMVSAPRASEGTRGRASTRIKHEQSATIKLCRSRGRRPYVENDRDRALASIPERLRRQTRKQRETKQRQKKKKGLLTWWLRVHPESRGCPPWSPYRAQLRA